jgi:hypothetical protein
MMYTSTTSQVVTMGTCVNLSCLPDSALQEALKVSDNTPISFLSRVDGSTIVCNKTQVLEEITNRKLRQEVKSVKFYDKSFINNFFLSF